MKKLLFITTFWIMKNHFLCCSNGNHCYLNHINNIQSIADLQGWCGATKKMASHHFFGRHAI